MPSNAAPPRLTMGLPEWTLLFTLGALRGAHANVLARGSLTCAAILLYFRLLASSGSINLMLVTLIIPVSALVLGAVFLGETIDARQFGGMLLIGLGLLVIDCRTLGMMQRRVRA